jgi:hypothetical protein
MEELNWAEHVNQKIRLVSTGMEKKQLNRFKVNFLKRVVKRVEEYSQAGCSECENYKVEVSRLISMLVDERNQEQPDFPTYEATLKQITKHLEKEHHLIEAGANMIKWLIIGLVSGAAFLSQYGGSVGIGLSLGIIIGTILDNKAKKEGKVI